MTSIFHKSSLLLVLLSCLTKAQAPPQREEEFPREQNIFFEALPMFSEDTSKASVDFHYRINKNFFVFVKDQATPAQERYIAGGELIIELLDPQGVSVGREIRKIELTRQSLLAPNERQADIQGAVTFAVPDGTFSIVFEVDDKESGRSFVERKQTVSTRKPILKALELSIPFFAQISAENRVGTSFAVLNRGLDILLGTRGGYLIQAYLPQNKNSFQVKWTIEGRGEGRTQERFETSGNQYSLLPGIPKLKVSDDGILYEAVPSKYSWNLVFIPLPMEKLETGLYNVELEFSLGENSVKLERRFRVSWPNRPASLSNFEIAVDALRLIAKEDEVEEMYGFTSLRGSQKFKEFWRKRDPDTTTAYNEVMAEFYRRVDEALRRYSSTKENDGYKTDRGRIFIIYGSPTKMERKLLPNSTPTEVWTYEKLKRRYIFSDPNRTGNFVLTETEIL